MPSKPFYLIVSGIDGSGKTSIIEAVRAALEADGLTCHYSWMRYTHVFVKPLHALARLLRLTRRYETPAGPLWRHEFYRWPQLARIYVPCAWADTLLGRHRLDRRVARDACDVVICDRWANDILIDLAVDFRDRGLVHGRWGDRIRTQMPDAAVQVVVMRDRDAILAARPESAHDPDFDLRLSLYQGLSANVTRISNTRRIEDAAADILALLAPVRTAPNRQASNRPGGPE
jgi:hypothetical protein